MSLPQASEVIELWFGDALATAAAAQARAKVWFSYDPRFDAELARRFGSLPQRARDGELDDWLRDPRAALARVIVLDQFPRNLYRDHPNAFAFDACALAGAQLALDAGWDTSLHPLEAVFLYLPFEHAEDIAMQTRSVALFERLATRAPPGYEDLFEGFADYARRHRRVIAELGRFPHRNAVVGRASTPAEEAYLQSGGERFGPSAR
ncbi:MAG: DUF924 domain-containing protein [Burkholderiales bacterium]|nr:DUF924 domain-containing protein [Burkholderiales bacterium]